MLSREDFAAEVARYVWVWRVRPMLLRSWLSTLLSSRLRRRLVVDELGCVLYVDPFSTTARHLTRQRMYEPETRAALTRLLGPGDTFLDIGANVGIIASFAGQIVGDTGRVIAVEPQDSLPPLIRVNLGLNGVRNARIVQGAVGGENGATGEMHIYPWVNCGESSIVRRYRFSRRTQQFRFFSPESILADAAVQEVDLVKVDVEGYEPEVVQALLPALQRGVVRRLLVDYHDWILWQRGISADVVHEQLTGAGMRPVEGLGNHDWAGKVRRRAFRAAPARPQWVTEEGIRLSGYVLYERSDPAVPGQGAVSASQPITAE